MKREPILKAVFALAIILGLVFLYVGQVPHFNLLLAPKRLLLYSAITGLAMGILLGRNCSKNEWELFEKVRIYVIFIVASIVFMPLFLSLINRYLDFGTPEYVEVELAAVKPLVDQPFGYVKGEKLKVTGYKVGIIMDKEIFDFRIDEYPFLNKEVGDRVEVQICRGALGLRFIDF